MAPGCLLCATLTTLGGSSGGRLSPHSVQGPWLSWTPFRHLIQVPLSPVSCCDLVSSDHPYQSSLSCTEPSKTVYIFLNPGSFPTLLPSQEPAWCYYPSPHQAPSWKLHLPPPACSRHILICSRQPSICTLSTPWLLLPPVSLKLILTWSMMRPLRHSWGCTYFSFLPQPVPDTPACSGRG